MKTDNRPIVLTRSEELASFLITIGSTLQKAASNKELKAEGNKLFIVEKNKEQVFDFDWDYDSVIDKYLDFIEGSREPTLLLSQEDSDLLRKTAHAAYYLMGESGKIPNYIEKYYNQYFKSKE